MPQSYLRSRLGRTAVRLCFRTLASLMLLVSLVGLFADEMPMKGLSVPALADAPSPTLVSGQVLDEQGNTLIATLSLYRLSISESDGLVKLTSQTTDRQGHFTLQVEPTAELAAIANQRGGWVSFRLMIWTNRGLVMRSFDRKLIPLGIDGSIPAGARWHTVQGDNLALEGVRIGPGSPGLIGEAKATTAPNDSLPRDGCPGSPPTWIWHTPWVDGTDVNAEFTIDEIHTPRATTASYTINDVLEVDHSLSGSAKLAGMIGIGGGSSTVRTQSGGLSLASDVQPKVDAFVVGFVSEKVKHYWCEYTGSNDFYRETARRLHYWQLEPDRGGYIDDLGIRPVAALAHRRSNPWRYDPYGDDRTSVGNNSPIVTEGIQQTRKRSFTAEFRIPFHDILSFGLSSETTTNVNHARTITYHAQGTGSTQPPNLLFLPDRLHPKYVFGDWGDPATILIDPETHRRIWPCLVRPDRKSDTPPGCPSDMSGPKLSDSSSSPMRIPDPASVTLYEMPPEIDYTSVDASTSDTSFSWSTSRETRFTRCTLDNQPSFDCRDTVSLQVGIGSHTFRVDAYSTNPNPDDSETYNWQILRPAPGLGFISVPPDGSRAEKAQTFEWDAANVDNPERCVLDNESFACHETLTRILPPGQHSLTITGSAYGYADVSIRYVWEVVQYIPPTLADVTGDGKADLVGRGESSAVQVGTGSGVAFNNSTPWGTWDKSYDIHLADANGDGKADILGRSSTTGDVQVGLSTGSSFANSTQWGTWRESYDIHFADVTGDGRADIIGRNYYTNQVEVGVSNGSSFVTSTVWGDWNPSYTVDFADVNGDGKADIVGRNQFTGDVQVGLSTGSLFQTSRSWATWSLSYDVHFADVSYDGRADIVGRNTDGDIQVGRSTGSEFQFSTNWGAWPGDYQMMFGEVDGDAHVDLVAWDANTLAIHVARSTGSAFITSPQWANWNPSYSVSFADVSGDGKADIVGRNSANAAVQVGVSSGTAFNYSTQWGFWSLGYDLHFADANGDGRVDIIGRNSNTNDIQVGLSTGTQFQISTRWGDWVPGWDLLYADVTGDGKADIIGRNQTTGEVLVGVSTGSLFQNATHWGSWNTNYSVFIADANGDGRADILGRGPGTDIQVGLSTGSLFQPSTQWGTWFNPFIMFGDITGDGKADIIGSDTSTGLVWAGVSTGSSFQNGSVWTRYWPGFNWQLADATGDGKADLLGRQQPNPTGDVWVLPSRGNSTFQSPYYWGSWNSRF